jgi:hypothetical protein
MIRRVLYFGYYLKKLDKQKLKLFQAYLQQKTGKSIFSQWISVFFHVLKYNISILEYYQFHFYEKSHEEKLKWAGTGYMFEYQKKMNPPSERSILDDKRKFAVNYKEFLIHRVFSLGELEENPKLIEELKNFNQLVFKTSTGKCGLGIVFKKQEDLKENDIVKYMKDNQFDLVESFIEQHPDMNRLSPSGVNTVRIFTQLDKEGNVEILGCRQRITINSNVDNMAAGNIAAPINEITGIIEGPGVYSDITKKPESKHPITGVDIVGFQVPFWKECLELVKRAAKKHPQNRSIGWDVVVTAQGPGLIEGNHDWCKLVWQLPVNQGLKHLLEKHV